MPPNPLLFGAEKNKETKGKKILKQISRQEAQAPIQFKKGSFMNKVFAFLIVVSISLLAACGTTNPHTGTDVPELNTQSVKRIVIKDLPFKARLDEAKQNYELIIAMNEADALTGGQGQDQFFKCPSGNKITLPVFDEGANEFISHANQTGWKAYEQLTTINNLDDWRLDLELDCQQDVLAKTTLKLGNKQFGVTLSQITWGDDILSLKNSNLAELNAQQEVQAKLTNASIINYSYDEQGYVFTLRGNSGTRIIFGGSANDVITLNDDLWVVKINNKDANIDFLNAVSLGQYRMNVSAKGIVEIDMGDGNIVDENSVTYKGRGSATLTVTDDNFEIGVYNAEVSLYSPDDPIF